MNLKEPLWSKQTDSDGSQPPSSSSARDPESDGAPSAATSAVEELIKSLNQQRIYREVTLALRTGLCDARAEFSFLRVRGLRFLLKSLRSIAQSDTSVYLFSLTQSIPELQVVPVLFEHSLKETVDDRVQSLDHIFSVEPMNIKSPSTDAEVALALRVLEGCCLLHPESTSLAHQHKAIPVLMNVLSTRGVLEQGACLDALISIMLDSSTNQTEFEACNGIEEVAELIRDKQVDETLRLKCGEFLLLLIGHVNGRDRSPMATIHEDVRRLLGEKSASLIWAASQFGSTLDPDQRLTALHIQARRVLESLDLY
ncbi:Armadillo-like helical [Corchorus olitorius]|uniref:Armadillo-like helical n=1 Tax=Corchorus olitorius TaxID=93759 RepID=A0A1R3JFF2_9ROSI|nr:Armadillo-like helical [Corchorus olitorius]